MQPAQSPGDTPFISAPAAAPRRRRSLAVFGVAIQVVLLAGTLGCNKESPPAAEEPRAPLAAPAKQSAPGAAQPSEAAAPAVAPAAGEPAAPAAGGKSRVSEATFELALTAAGSYEAGKPGEASLVLDAKAPYHVNDKYPYKFKLKPADGLSYGSEVVGKDRAKLETMRVTMPVAFTPQKVGRHTLAGQFSFSVCTEDKCLIEKRELALDIDVK